MSFPVEEIPHTDCVFYRVHRNDTRNGEPIPGAFRNVGERMSADWEKYSTASQSRQRAKAPIVVGIVSLLVGAVREIESLSVQHVPEHPANRAHTEVFGKKDAEVRLKLLRIYEWKIKPDDPLV